jgi:catechol 2,3-dioxygenase
VKNRVGGSQDLESKGSRMVKVLPQINHVGIYVHDTDRMVDFYTRVLGMAITDSGEAASVKTHVTFLSSNPRSHHQLVLVQWPEGRERGPSTVNQLSFKVETIDELRTLLEKVRNARVAEVKPLNHGNALSVYTHDPEGNGIELYMDLPWYVSQPFGDPLDLSQPDDDILRLTEARVRSDPTFQPRSEWAEGLKRRLEQEDA